MKENDHIRKLQPWIYNWRVDYDAKTFLNSFGSLLITTVFALYNGLLGILHSSPWHGSICVYYLLLVAIRFSILITERHVMKNERQGNAGADKIRNNIYLLCSVLLLMLNISLIGPISLLVRMKRAVHMTLIPAIAMAAYAFFKMSAASVNLIKRKRSINCLVRLLRVINFIDALLSILSLQNTLIMVTTADTDSLLILTAVTSGMIWLGMVCLSCTALVRSVRLRESRENTENIN